MSLLLKCRCGKKLKAPKQSVGKRARCSACGAKFTIPDNSKGEDSTKDGNSHLDRELNDFFSQFNEEATHSGSDVDYFEGTSTSSLNDTCYHCGEPMAESSVLCTKCGYHKHLERCLEVQDPKVFKEKKWHAFAFSLFVVPLIIAASYPLQATMDGPYFLRFYCLCFLFVGLSVLAFRHWWVDADVVTWAALITLLGIGGLRLGLALSAGKTNVMFLVLGMFIIVSLFVWARTESQLKQHTMFISPSGGLAKGPYLLSMAIALMVYGFICFVPAVGAAVLASGPIPFVIAFVFVSMGLTETKSGGGGYGGSSSSCGSSCGSGCGGGGGCGGGCGG